MGHLPWTQQCFQNRGTTVQNRHMHYSINCTTSASITLYNSVFLNVYVEIFGHLQGKYCEIPSQFNQHAFLGSYLIFKLIFLSSFSTFQRPYVPITHPANPESSPAPEFVLVERQFLLLLSPSASWGKFWVSVNTLSKDLV